MIWQIQYDNDEVQQLWSRFAKGINLTTLNLEILFSALTDRMGKIPAPPRMVRLWPLSGAEAPSSDDL